MCVVCVGVAKQGIESILRHCYTNICLIVGRKSHQMSRKQKVVGVCDEYLPVREQNLSISRMVLKGICFDTSGLSSLFMSGFISLCLLSLVKWRSLAIHSWLRQRYTNEQRLIVRDVPIAFVQKMNEKVWRQFVPLIPQEQMYRCENFIRILVINITCAASVTRLEDQEDGLMHGLMHLTPI